MDAVDKGDAAQFCARRDPAPDRLGAAQLPDGPAHRPRPLPRVPDLQLPADDAADRRLHARCRSRRSSRYPHVNERVELYYAHAEAAEEQIRRCATVHGNLVVLDLRDEEVIHPTNRFTLYALFPQCNISIHVLWGLRQQNTVFATGKSILDRGVEDERRRADAHLRRRRPRGGRHLPGRERGRRARARRAVERRSTPTASRLRRPVKAADAHLTARTRSWRRLIDDFGGPLPLEPDSRGRPADVYGALLRAITGQQLSVKAARAIYGRLTRALRRPRRPRPSRCSPTTRTSCAPPPGSRTPRSRSLRSLAEHVWPASSSSTACATSPTARSSAS